jgi:enoyl-CoA hydratase
VSRAAARAGGGGFARIEIGAGRRVPLLDESALEDIDRRVRRAEAEERNAILLSGGRHGIFAAGADLERLAGLDPAAAWRFAARGQEILDRLAAFRGVVVAAVGGRCIGGAFDLVLACDLRIADAAARFEHPGPRLGFITGYGGTERLPRTIGVGAGPILAGARVLDAATALARGLVMMIAPAEEMLARAAGLAESVGAIDRRRILLVKEALRRLGPSARRRPIEASLTALARSSG